MIDYNEFVEAFYLQSGIDLKLYKEKQMKRRLTSLAEKHGFKSFMSFFHAMMEDRRLYDIFVNYMTINVSEFYRNPGQWKLLEDVIIPMLRSAKKDFADIKIWSSACSTGDEPYTLVMILNKFVPLDKIKILASDIDLAAIEKAKQGVYHERSIKDLPLEFKNKYFSKVNENTYKISEDVISCVEFRQINLLADDYPKENDLIICRNVLIYFTEEAKYMVYKKFNLVLAQDGILFLGNTEQIISSAKFGLKPIRTFFYQKVRDVRE
ncbi:MAG: protein-glutamate O-methyltransferase CheR [Clostridiaceae bacterium]|nr:protein-glutamate O-methyltransferase CheR [Clostridiaceae bacterium]